jgi:hypothetical protein
MLKYLKCERGDPKHSAEREREKTKRKDAAHITDTVQQKKKKKKKK